MDSPFRFSLSDLLRAPGSSRRVTVEGCLAGLRTPIGGVPDDSPLAVSGRLDALFEGIWFEGTVTGSYRMECVRCLTDVDVPFELPAAELFSADLPPGSDEGYPMRGDQIDLAPLVGDTALLGVPVRPLCQPDCAGLCARCGAELNAGPCGCPAEEGHPALAQLARLFSSDR